MAHSLPFYNNFELWGGCFFKTKHSNVKSISPIRIDRMLNYFNQNAFFLIKRWCRGIASVSLLKKTFSSNKFIKRAKGSIKYICYPKIQFKISNKSYSISYRINVCENLNIIKIFYYLQSEESLSEEEILKLSKKGREIMRGIAADIEKSILSDNELKEILGAKLKSEEFNLNICNVNTLNTKLRANIYKLMEECNKDFIKSNSDIQHTLRFLYNLNEDEPAQSLEQVKNEVITKYTENQFATTEAYGIQGFYVYYLSKERGNRSVINYLGISPRRSLKVMHSLNKNIALSYANNI